LVWKLALRQLQERDKQGELTPLDGFDKILEIFNSSQEEISVTSRLNFPSQKIMVVRIFNLENYFAIRNLVLQGKLQILKEEDVGWNSEEEDPSEVPSLVVTPPLINSEDASRLMEEEALEDSNRVEKEVQNTVNELKKVLPVGPLKEEASYASWKKKKNKGR